MTDTVKHLTTKQDVMNAANAMRVGRTAVDMREMFGKFEVFLDPKNQGMN